MLAVMIATSRCSIRTPGRGPQDQAQGVPLHACGPLGASRGGEQNALDLAFAQGGSPGSETSQLVKLLDQYELLRCAALSLKRSNAVRRAFLRSASCFVGNFDPHYKRLMSAAIHTRNRVDVRPHDLETYHELERAQGNTSDDDRGNGEQ
jgi:hypothetical protein